MKTTKNFDADKYLELNLEFWQDLEKHCVAECCGIGAFDFSKENIKETIVFYNELDITNNLEELVTGINNSKTKTVSSSILNLSENKEIFKTRIEKILSFI